MSLTKTDTALGNYIETGSKKINAKAVNRKAYRQAVTSHNTAYTLGILANKHKVALLALGNVVLVLNYVFPEWTELVKSLF